MDTDLTTPQMMLFWAWCGGMNAGALCHSFMVGFCFAMACIALALWEIFE